MGEKNNIFSRKEIFKYLDNLRQTGETNMFGAPSFVASKFKMSPEKARTFVKEWMEN
tara:strand:+ start:635 stop:805 length:171 start_codon:yes stop_codon:yes gene_type:complete